MKKQLLFLAIALTGLISCSSDDNENTTTADPLIGVWYLFSSEGTEVSDCRKNSTYTFTAEGKYSFVGMIKDAEGVCIEDFKFFGTWENVEGNKYKNTDGETGETGISEYIFTDNNNTLTLGTVIVLKRK